MSENLGEFEQLVMFAVLRLDDDAYGASVRDELKGRAGRDVSPGAIFTTLERLEGRGLVTSRYGEPTPERGGRRKRFYRLTADGPPRARPVSRHGETHGSRPRAETGAVMTRHPPRVPEWLLLRLLDDDSRESVAGDLEEEYRRVADRAGTRTALRWYWQAVVRSIIACRVTGHRVPESEAIGLRGRLAGQLARPGAPGATPVEGPAAVFARLCRHVGAGGRRRVRELCGGQARIHRSPSVSR